MTVLGMLGVTTLSAIFAFRIFVAVFVEYGIDEALIAKAFNAYSGEPSSVARGHRSSRLSSHHLGVTREGLYKKMQRLDIG